MATTSSVTRDPAQLPEHRVLPLMGQGKLAARIEQPADDHGQTVVHPRLVARVDHLRQTQLLGQSQQRVAGAVFLGKEDLEGVRRILGHDITAEGRLDELELLQGQADDAAMVGVSDFTVLPEGGT